MVTPDAATRIAVGLVPQLRNLERSTEGPTILSKASGRPFSLSPRRDELSMCSDSGRTSSFSPHRDQRSM